MFLTLCHALPEITGSKPITSSLLVEDQLVSHYYHYHYHYHCHYQGSTTYPGCWETVTWLVMNKPLYLSKQEMELFHGLRQVCSRSKSVMCLCVKLVSNL